jgi:hypothetical protein
VRFEAPADVGDVVVWAYPGLGRELGRRITARASLRIATNCVRARMERKESAHHASIVPVEIASLSACKLDMVCGVWEVVRLL